MLTRILDRTATGCPLFCELTLVDKGGEQLAKRKMVYSPTDTDDELLKKLNPAKGAKPSAIRIRVLIEWINNKAIKYDNEQRP